MLIRGCRKLRCFRVAKENFGQRVEIIGERTFLIQLLRLMDCESADADVALWDRLRFAVDYHRLHDGEVRSRINHRQTRHGRQDRMD